MRKMFKNAKAKHGLNKHMDLRLKLVSFEGGPNRGEEEGRGKERRRGRGREEEEKGSSSQDQKSMELLNLGMDPMTFVWNLV